MKYDKNAMIEKAAHTVPDERQIKWQETEFYAHVHFGVNTFVGKEEGDGKTEANAFFPTDFNAEQWVEACVCAGMKGLILNCKHRDGFCLWPTNQTDYSVKSSPFLDGKGDIVKEVSEACRKAGLKFGISLCLCDRHEKTYYQGDKYDDFFDSLLTELLCGYGEIFEVRLDDYCEKHEKRSFDFDRYYKTIRKYAPNAVIAKCGPDVRWIGNDFGICRESEWSTVPESEKFSQNISRSNKMDMNLGSIKNLVSSGSVCWYPAEVNISIRKGQFFHKFEHMDLIPISKLKDIYIKSAGSNAALMLGIPADRRGQFHDDDVALLKAFGADIKAMFDKSVAVDCVLSSSSEREHDADCLLSCGEEYWKSDINDTEPELTIKFTKNENIRFAVLSENIRTGQQIENFKIFCRKNNKFKKIGKYTTIGYKKIIVFPEVISTDEIKIVFEKKRIFAAISNIKFYK